MFNDREKKGFNIRTYDMSQVEKLKRMYDIKLTDDQKNLYQDICYGNNLIKSSDAVFPA